MKKSVATLSGAALALLLSAGQSMAGSVSLATYLATSKTTIYQNETLTLNAALHTRDNAQDCSTGFPPQQVVYKVAGGRTYAGKASRANKSDRLCGNTGLNPVR